MSKKRRSISAAHSRAGTHTFKVLLDLDLDVDARWQV